jgi:hypothetical protein
MKNLFHPVPFLLATATGVLFSTETHQTSEAERLAKTVCASCHLFPEPSLLPQSVWKETVLPQMGYQLGIYPSDSFRLHLLEQGKGGEKLIEAGIFPAQPRISREDWEKITTYYLKRAPQTLGKARQNKIHTGLSHFQTRLPNWKVSIPSTTMVRIQPGRGIILGDANTRRMIWINDSLKLIKAAKLMEGVVDAQETPNGMFVTMMGSFSPTDAPSGTAIFLNDQTGRAQLLLENLQRPVCSVWEDFNQDGKTDAVVAEYAKWTGGLFYYEQQTDGTFSKHPLRIRPGAIKIIVRDFNNDRLPDLIALFGQGDEGIFKYLNLGQGKFREEAVLRFPPSYGSSGFRLTDVDADGLEDIVYTCGDNADYKPIMKPYHGVRTFRNNGKGGYVESFFYPMNGAYDAVFQDFDKDGDLDIATIAFFPDFVNDPQAGFQYLENTGNFQFQPHTFQEVAMGRWIVMDVGDVDLDGDWDIALGPLTFEVAPDGGEVRRWVENGLPFVLLENTIIP